MQTIESRVIIQDDKLTIPAEIRENLGLTDGCKLMLVSDEEDIRLVNPLMHAMRKFQKGMEGAAEEAGWKSDDDVAAYIMEMRRGHQ